MKKLISFILTLAFALSVGMVSAFAEETTLEDAGVSVPGVIDGSLIRDLILEDEGVLDSGVIDGSLILDPINGGGASTNSIASPSTSLSLGTWVTDVARYKDSSGIIWDHMGYNWNVPTAGPIHAHVERREGSATLKLRWVKITPITDQVIAENSSTTLSSAWNNDFSSLTSGNYFGSFRISNINKVIKTSWWMIRK